MEIIDMNDQSTTKIGRRALIGSMAMATPAALAAKTKMPQPPVLPVVPKPNALEVIAYPFGPDGLAGLSEKLLTSHYANNYAGAVKRLGAIHSELGSADFASLPGYRLNGLKREELIAWNSKLLHEVYFAGIGNPTAPQNLLGQAIEYSFGSFDKWRAEFVAMGKALGGGSGWVLLSWSAADLRLANIWASDHTQTQAGGVPLLALDMYEHAYAIDYGAKAAAYVDAYMGIIDWTHASHRFASLIA
jgi:superoxide dismutase, Fe-Mn family